MKSTTVPDPQPAAPLPSQWALFPFLQLAFQLGDVNALIANRTPGATLYGASKAEKATLVLGKVAHYTLLLAVPFALHGGVAALTGWAAYVAAQVGNTRNVAGHPGCPPGF